MGENDGYEENGDAILRLCHSELVDTGTHRTQIRDEFNHIIRRSNKKMIYSIQTKFTMQRMILDENIYDEKKSTQKRNDNRKCHFFPKIYDVLSSVILVHAISIPILRFLLPGRRGHAIDSAQGSTRSIKIPQRT